MYLSVVTFKSDRMSRVFAYCALNNRSAAGDSITTVVQYIALAMFMHDTFDRSLVGRGAHPAFIRGEQRSYSGPCCPRVYTVAPSRHAARASDERSTTGRGSLCSTVGVLSFNVLRSFVAIPVCRAREGTVKLNAS